MPSVAVYPVSMSPPRDTHELEKQLSHLARIAIAGSLIETTLTCGTKSCACHKDPSRRHGPHLSLKYKDEQGHGRSLYVPRSHEQEVREAVEAWSALWQTIVALGHCNREALAERVRSRQR